ncbi:NAD(P)/FAD-dependent oxidoreductase [Cognatiluteimonas lumbrici]|uniref:NAD(P)/FAD-dependent oxidoreductase n=1 Tax=Cognatiluteimonas lumbrici TaxID=2559601 RepID=UPI00112E3D74|nr:FAD-dependent oxidoreductase [Luteimonas lumbrici]
MPARDVVVLGGGLAGLTLALQLRQRDPAIDVLVLERNPHPVAEAAFKVGESTVECGAHYFADVLGLRAHLEREQLAKFGLRYFFNHRSGALDRCTELGVGQGLPTGSFQLDRGRFENFLGGHALEQGVDFRDGARVVGVDMGSGGAPHRVTFERGGDTHVAEARWVVDASGRAGLLKRKLGLAERNGHDANAAWWRVDGRIDINDWSDDPEWLARCTPPDRWRSTNHLCGPGYWFWLIPLASGSHSLGIVCDARMHPLETMKTHELAMAWLRDNQPQAADALEASGAKLQDFRFLRGFSHGCRQVFSKERWALTGEAGAFLDPFYSPGSDFIALSNTYVAELVLADRAGEPFEAYAPIYEQLYFAFYENALALYRDQYPIFGNALVMPLKIMWDYAFYWSLLAPVYFGGRQAVLPVMGRLKPVFLLGSALNAGMQALLRDWGLRDGRDAMEDGRWLDQHAIDWARGLNGALRDELDDDAFIERIRANVARMRALAGELLAQARRHQPGIADHGLEAMCDPDAAAEPLLPANWTL